MTEQAPRAGTCSLARIRFSTVMALMLAILGSAVLPVSYAFATTGIVSGFAMAAVRSVASALFFTGQYTCHKHSLGMSSAAHVTSKVFGTSEWCFRSWAGCHNHYHQMNCNSFL